MSMTHYIWRGIETLGIPKSHKCPNCGKRDSLNYQERQNLAESILNNGAGLWALLHCDGCGWADTFYPTAINGVACTREECDALHKEIREHERWQNR